MMTRDCELYYSCRLAYYLVSVMKKYLFNIRARAISSDSLPLFASVPHVLSRLLSPGYQRNIAITHRRMDSIDGPLPQTCAPVEYMPLEDMENPDQYCPGGYHPISIGDRLNGRYDIVHNLASARTRQLG